jgi:hypothetical protein
LEVYTSDIRLLTTVLAVLPTYSLSTVLTVHLGLTHLWRLRSSNPFYHLYSIIYILLSPSICLIKHGTTQPYFASKLFSVPRSKRISQRTQRKRGHREYPSRRALYLGVLCVNQGSIGFEKVPIKLRIIAEA